MIIEPDSYGGEKCVAWFPFWNGKWAIEHKGYTRVVSPADLREWEPDRSDDEYFEYRGQRVMLPGFAKS